MRRVAGRTARKEAENMALVEMEDTSVAGVTVKERGHKSRVTPFYPHNPDYDGTAMEARTYVAVPPWFQQCMVFVFVCFLFAKNA